MEDRTLFQLTDEMMAIEEQLWENGGELTPELEEATNDTLPALRAKVDGYGSLIRKFQASSAALATEIKRLQAIKKTMDNGEKRLKERLEYNMKAHNITLLEGSMTRVSFKKNPKALEVDEEVVLSNYQERIQELIDSLPSYIKIDVSVSKDAIKQMEKEAGILPAGVEWTQGKSLNIR